MTTTTELPMLRLDPATLGDLDADLEREWIVTNGLGGYALGSVSGAATRSYSGLLVAAVRPPTERMVLVAKVDETATLVDGSIVRLGTNEYADGTIYPRGFERLTEFALEGSVPRWTFRLEDGAEVNKDGARLEKRVWTAHGYNLTFVQYRYVAGKQATPITLALTPFCLERDHHGVTREWELGPFLVDAEPSACALRATADALAYRLVAGPEARFALEGDWNRSILHRADRARGLPDTEDAYIPGTFGVALAPGATATLALSAERTLPEEMSGMGGAGHEEIAARALEREHARCRALLERVSGQGKQDDFLARLVLAADQFLVARPDGGEEGGDLPVTVIAGYPWFTDWGRDTMIALPGLTLVTGRYEEARGLLCTFARYLDHGMIPNRFPDATTHIPACGSAVATEPEYNTVDATLWYFYAFDHYLHATGDWALLSQIFPLLDDVIGWHMRGTHYNIGVDPSDGLLHAGAEGVQLTWMDARVDGWVVTPRSGKPVEINALWHNTLRLMSAWSRRLGQDTARYDELRSSVERSFLARFWYPAGGYLYDVVDVDGRPGVLDWSLRPNQLIALAVAPSLVPEEQARSVLSVVERELLSPLGLRSLTPADPRFAGMYSGDRRARDAAYHQGTIWPWLLGGYANACLRIYGDTERVQALLAPFQRHLLEAGVGTVSEIVQGAPPFAPEGCLAQAWSVAELLRIAALV